MWTPRSAFVRLLVASLFVASALPAIDQPGAAADLAAPTADAFAATARPDEDDIAAGEAVPVFDDESPLASFRPSAAGVTRLRTRAADGPGGSITTVPPNNGSGGIFLDLTPAAGALTFDAFDTYISSTAGTAVQIEVWTRPGTYVGNTGSNTGWTLAETVSGTSAGSTNPAPFTLATPIPLPAGQTTAIYLHAITVGGGIRYTGTAGSPPQTTWSNADITLFSDVSRTGAVPFGGSQFTPRTFAGTAYYSSGAGPVTVCNSTPTTIPNSGPATPYPSSVTVAGGATISSLVLQLNGLTHTFPDDIDVLLQGPGGQTLIVMSDAGLNGGVTGVDLTLDDTAALPLPDGTGIGTGTWLPTNYGANDPFVAPAPAGPYGNATPAGTDTLGSVFGGLDPNGTWNLWIVDDVGGDLGSLAEWCLVINGGGPSADPDIAVDPTSLSNAQLPDTQVDLDLDITNEGDLDLEWEIVEAPALVELDVTKWADLASEGTINLILDDGTNENGIGLTGGGEFIFLNRFTVAAPFTLTEIQLFTGTDSLCNTTDAVDFYVYEDADGNPANGATHIGSLEGQTVGTLGQFNSYPVSIAVNGPGDVLIAVVNRGCDLNGQFPASIDQTASQARSWVGLGTAPGNPPVLPFPTFGTIDSFGFPGNWLIRGVGTAGGGSACVSPADVPWLAVAPTIGTTAGGATDTVTVTLDSTGLTPGTYDALLCIESNDPDEALVEVPVSLTVIATPVIDVAPTSLAATLAPGQTEDQTLTISNSGDGDLIWAIDEAAAGLVEGTAGVLWDNGPLVTHPGPPDRSRLQETSLGMNLFGFGAQITANNAMADDFTIPAGEVWQIETLKVFTYQTGSTTTSTINDLRVQIWDGAPNAGGTVVWGDLTTNRLTSTTWTNIYRDQEAAPTATNRPIMEVVATVGTPLPAGTYWIEYQFGGTLASGPWAPPVTILGVTNTGDALQRQAAVWAPAIDTGASGTENFPQGMPFLVEGSSSPCDNPEDLPWVSVNPASGTTAPAGNTVVTVTFDAGALAVGLYEGLLCVDSNDPATPRIEVPVALTVDTMPFIDGFESGTTSAWSFTQP